VNETELRPEHHHIKKDEVEVENVNDDDVDEKMYVEVQQQSLDDYPGGPHHVSICAHPSPSLCGLSHV